MVDELNLQEIKNIEYNIICHFKEFCKTHNIKYFISNGTLLGAVKYEGFIPWDDDVDVVVPREDYDKLIKIYQDTNQFKLYSIERNEDFKFTYAKLCDMTTVKIESNVNNGIQLGLDIDIFPLDNCTKHILKKRIFKKIKMYQLGCILSKFESINGKSWYKKLIIMYCKTKGYKYFDNKLRSLVKMESKKGCDNIGCLMWPIYGEREVMSSKIFSDSIQIKFENDYFSAPIEYDIYLKNLYGDYKQDPPLNKQKTHHSFKAYRIK